MAPREVRHVRANTWLLGDAVNRNTLFETCLDDVAETYADGGSAVAIDRFQSAVRVAHQ